MSRIEWSRREPGEIETVISIMMSRRDRHARRLRPSQGDGGIDVYVPTPAGWVVYQIKSFTGRLNASQKRQIEKSWQRVQEFAAANGLAIAAWYLVRPENNTSSEIRFLEDLSDEAPYRCDWLGLDFCEGLAAEFPDVVDYYLFDGKDRLDEAIRANTFRFSVSLLGKVTTPSNRPAHSPPSKPMHRALNRLDPHYRFDFSLGEVVDGRLPSVSVEEPHLA